MIQKEIFLKTEGDKWFQRNFDTYSVEKYENDKICELIKNYAPNPNQFIFEVGCSAGYRLKYLSQLGFTVSGIEPSEQAVIRARLNGVNVMQGTADHLIINDNSVDILIFGFCLYLVDPSDYFKIAFESYRVLKDDGIMILHDFAPKSYYKKSYKHLDGVNSYKFDFTNILLTHPHLVLKSKTTEIHSNLKEDINNQNEWVQISTIAKHTNLF
jgi:ubiquinone/menaquinone biosynthesis C-methylase UbiE